MRRIPGLRSGLVEHTHPCTCGATPGSICSDCRPEFFTVAAVEALPSPPAGHVEFTTTEGTQVRLRGRQIGAIEGSADETTITATIGGIGRTYHANVSAQAILDAHRRALEEAEWGTGA